MSLFSKLDSVIAGLLLFAGKKSVLIEASKEELNQLEQDIVEEEFVDDVHIEYIGFEHNVAQLYLHDILFTFKIV